MTDYIIRGGHRIALPDMVDPWNLIGDMEDYGDVEWNTEVYKRQGIQSYA